jgi:hypothetical protein
MDRGDGEHLFGDMVDTRGIGWRAADAIQGEFALCRAGSGKWTRREVDEKGTNKKSLCPALRACEEIILIAKIFLLPLRENVARIAGRMRSRAAPS